MSLLAKVSSGFIKQPDLMLIHGPDGVGKSTFAAQAPATIFLGTESGTGRLNVKRFPEMTSFLQVLQAIQELTEATHEFQTLAVDSLDWLEPLVFSHVVAQANDRKVKSIEDFGYGKGYVMALDEHRKFISALTKLRAAKKMNIILIAHSMIKKFEDPRSPQGYDRFIIKLHDKAAALYREFVDFVGFATYKIYTSEKDGKTKAFGGEERVIHTSYSAAWDAKNRMGLPAEIALDWTQYKKLAEYPDPSASQTITTEIEAYMPKLKAEHQEYTRQAISQANGDYSRLVQIRDGVAKLATA